MIAFLAAAALVASYDCEAGGISALKTEGAAPTLTKLDIPTDLAKWKFTVSIEDAPRMTAEVKWAGNPIQSEGKFPTISTGKDVYSFASVSAGPCLLTETMCAALITIAERADGTAKVLIQPTAHWTDKKAGTRDPFVAVMEGQCKKTGGARQ